MLQVQRRAWSSPRATMFPDGFSRSCATMSHHSIVIVSGGREVTSSKGTRMRRLRLVIWIVSALAVMAIPAVSTAQIISITIAPPELPLYEQPEISAPGYLSTPGYLAYGPVGYS